MAPQLSEHVLVSLLRQCFTTHACRTSRIRRQTHFGGSKKALHTEFRSCSQLRPAQQIEARLRDQGQDELSTDVVASLPQTKFKFLNSDEPHEYYPSSVLSRRQNTSHGRGQQPKKKQHVAVLGGGITGLSAVHYLLREFPNAEITLYEGSDRLGGWLHSKQVDVGNGYITLEQGPRTLRPHSPAGLVTLEMIQHLGLEEQILTTPKDSVSAQNRFVYYPDRLVRMPGPGQDFFDMAWRILTEPVFKGVSSGVIGEYSRPRRPENLQDESVASFLERRLGTPDIGDNIVSAVLHGIYAGDIYKLSARSLLRSLYYQESLYGSFMLSTFNSIKAGGGLLTKRDANLVEELQPKLSGLSTVMMSSVYTFKKGIGALTQALDESLRGRSNVNVRMNEKVTSLTYDGKSNAIQVMTTINQAPVTFDKVISTISGRHLSTIVSDTLPSLAKTHAVTVMVVNVYFKDSNCLPERGFGYLIPRSVPFEENPECALGVVFDSDAVVGQDTAPGTKVTVMLGGHWWDGYDSYPDEEEGAAMAKAVLRRHLKIEEEPAFINVSLQRECIPQYTVGHESRMAAAREELIQGFNGKLAVAGNSYGGVGLNDCVRSARDVVMDMKDDMSQTGLEYAGNEGWERMIIRRKE